MANRKILLGGGASIPDTDPYGNPVAVQDEPVDFDQPDLAGQTPVVSGVQRGAVAVQSSAGSRQGTNSNTPLTTGITKNLRVDVQRKSPLGKLCRTLFQGIPYMIDDDITMFQVFPDASGSSMNAMGNACDQVIVYGRLNAGAIADNNEVEVYGRRDADNNIVAARIFNKASGTTVTPGRVIPVPVIWAVTVIVFAALAVFTAMYGMPGVAASVVVVILLVNLPRILKFLAIVLGILFITRR